MTPADNETGLLAEIVDDVVIPRQLPESAGLSALADDVASSQPAQSLRQLSVELAHGRALADAAVDPRFGLPPALCELLIAGGASGQLVEVAQRYAAIARRRRDWQRELTLLLVYPTMLFGLLFFVGLINWLIIRPIYLSFFAQTEILLQPWIVGITWLLGPGLASITGMVAAVVVVLALTWKIGGKRVAHMLRQEIPLLGPVYRYRAVSEFADLLGLFVQAGLPLPGALRWTAQGLSDATSSAACGRLADDVQGGMALGQALDAKGSILSPLAPMVMYGEQHGVLAETLAAVAEMYGSRTEVQAGVLRMAVPPMLVLIVAAMAGLAFMAVIWPLFELIRWLT